MDIHKQNLFRFDFLVFGRCFAESQLFSPWDECIRYGTIVLYFCIWISSIEIMDRMLFTRSWCSKYDCVFKLLDQNQKQNIYFMKIKKKNQISAIMMLWTNLSPILSIGLPIYTILLVTMCWRSLALLFVAKVSSFIFISF